MSTFDSGPLADVHARTDGDARTLVLTRELRHPPERMWAALTEPGQIAAWAPYTADRDLARTGGATLTMIDGDTRVPLDATVTEVDPPRLLGYTWGGDRLRWELEPTGDGTRLTLRHTTPDPEMLAKAAAGWHLCLRVAERLLDGDPIPPIRGSQALEYGWQELHDAYAARLGVSEAGRA